MKDFALGLVATVTSPTPSEVKAKTWYSAACLRSRCVHIQRGAEGGYLYYYRDYRTIAVLFTVLLPVLFTALIPRYFRTITAIFVLLPRKTVLLQK